MNSSHLPTFYLKITQYGKLDHAKAEELFALLQGRQKGILADNSPWGLGVVLDSCSDIVIALNHSAPAKQLFPLIGNRLEGSVYFNYAWSKRNDNDQCPKGNPYGNQTWITLQTREYDKLASNPAFQWLEKIDDEWVPRTHTFTPWGLNPIFVSSKPVL